MLSVASGRALDSIRLLFGQEIRAWEAKGVKIAVRERLAGELLIFCCEVRDPFGPDGLGVMRNVKSALASGLSHIIIDEYEKVLVVRLIDENYLYLSSRDRDAIKSKVLAKLGQDATLDAASGGSTGRSQRKSRVWAKLAEYLEKEDKIIIEGFITFRLKEYLEELFDIVESTVESYLTEREYREFLKLLRHFMSRQKNALSVVNLVRKDNTYAVLDQSLNPVQGEVARFLSKPPRGMDLGIDDLIVSAVVTLAPERLIWHGLTKDSPCYDLLHDLLEESITICPGCSLETPE